MAVKNSIQSSLAYRVKQAHALGGGLANPPKPTVPKLPGINLAAAAGAFGGGAIGAVKPITNVSPFGAAPSVPAPPAGATAAAGGAAPPVDPLAKYKDSTYFATIAQNLATRGAGLASWMRRTSG
jgi:hypothetical protein